ncbi:MULTISPECIES: VOC family protein [unclassified Cryobacterium]|uniref:VOC family protein n=1 Tax=unclassified Cryobacterium TaxID=2649013 RepID=UPI002AB40859|nr:MULTISPECIES: VOC family protein [unclassified Cryobacterium]MDY7527151.1 VOC family protein [Cryobacterium sp. 10C2]MEB0286278.1 VOC family protein [Cryobacterium sp. 10S3]MEB0291707.1 VOC family protein [Cryobacterium sp. 10C2]WPX14612.1 VOC family protein [Cryobacterium sp. 10S3]
MSATGSIQSPVQTGPVLAGGPFVHLDGALHASYRTSDFASAVRFLDRVAEAADAAGHHPDVELGYGTVAFRLRSHDLGGVTERDLRLALQIQALANELGAEGTAVTPARYDVAIDCTDADSIRPFWRVGLGYVELPADGDGDGDVELVDPRGHGPRVWFQHMEIARTDRNRIHLDVYVPGDDAEERVSAIVEAGGTLLTDEHAPEWWVLADVEGNELCVCTSSY